MGRPMARMLLLFLTLPCLSLLCSADGNVSSGAALVADEKGLLPNAPNTQPEVPKPGGAMEDLLHWAIQHSDPDKLKEVMEKYASSNLTLKDVYGQDVIDALFIDEHAVISRMIRTIADFQNVSLVDEDLEAALGRVEDFVEQIDNAANLHRMGGLAPLLDLGLEGGAARGPEVRAAALLTLGVAMHNNPPVQDDVLSLSGLQRLALRLPSCDAGVTNGESAAFCGKLLYVTSALVKNNDTIQARASELGLFEWMLGPGLAHPSLAVAKKAMGIVETVIAQNAELPFLTKLVTNEELQASVARVLLGFVRGGASGSESDTDTPEKALRLISQLLAVRPMLFPISFRQDLTLAAASAKARCEEAFAVGDELCEVLSSLAADADAALAARDVRDDEL